MLFIHKWLFAIFVFNIHLPLFSVELDLVSTESDPDAFIQHTVNVINGDYCECAQDLVIYGPDSLVLQRFYSTKNPITGTSTGNWRIFPERFLVIGKDLNSENSFALIGEHSGSILPYSGKIESDGTIQQPLKTDYKCGIGMVNTHASDITGKTNHQNNLLYYKKNTCELTLGDGSQRIYKRVKKLPSSIMGEDITPHMVDQVLEPHYFLLMQEILPSGNRLFFSYDNKKHLTRVEMKNKNEDNTLSWIAFSYEHKEDQYRISMQTSDDRNLVYDFKVTDKAYQLVSVTGSHCIPITYEYNKVLTKKNLPEGRFVKIEYENDKVKCLKGPHNRTGEEEIVHSFSYQQGYTDVFNITGVKTRYSYNDYLQLTSITQYDDSDNIYRIDEKFWGRTASDSGRLLAKTIKNSQGHVHSYRSFIYDTSGNVLQEKLYGNLTGKTEKISLNVSSDGELLNSNEEECNIKKFEYSSDGFNLLLKMSDCKGSQILYTYKPSTNLLIKKLILDSVLIKKRTFQSYNDDAVCTRIIEDDGHCENESKIYCSGVTARFIKEIIPRKVLPGVGLPETMEERVLDLKLKKEILVTKIVTTYDHQSNLLSSSIYDANNQYAFREEKSYNTLGKIISETDKNGKRTNFCYDALGNQVSISGPQENSLITTYDFHNQPVKITQITSEGQFTTSNTFDTFGRKIQSTDRFGNSTQYQYDSFGRLAKITYPKVLDENDKVAQPTFEYTYDLFGNVTTLKDPKGFITKKNYTIRGKPTRIEYPDGSFELFKYDTEGTLHRSLTRDRVITVYEYDSEGRCSYEEKSTLNEKNELHFHTGKARIYTIFGLLRDTTDKSHVKMYSHDSLGRVIGIFEYKYNESEKSPKSRKTEIGYDSLSRISWRKIWFDIGEYDYSLEYFEYDLSGNILKNRIEDAQGTILLERNFSYSLQGDCIEEYSTEKDKRNSLIKTFYNSEREPIGYVDANGAETKIIIDTSHINTLNQNVLKKTIINSLEIKTELEFDALGRVCLIVKKDPFDVLLSSQRILYDLLGNKACEIHDQIAEKNVISSQKNQWIYGPLGRLEEEIQAVGSSVEKRIRYAYNSLGKVISKTIQGTEGIISYTYKADGTLDRMEVKNDRKELQISNHYVWDKNGNITYASSSDGISISRTYDIFNQPIKEQIYNKKDQHSLEYAYDRQGRIKQITLPDNSKINYTYDALFCRTVDRIIEDQIIYTHTYDQYDLQGRLIHETHIGQIGPEEHTYGRSGKKKSRKNDFLTEEYVEDPLGRLKEVKGTENAQYDYTLLSQLCFEKKGETITHEYDSLDNPIIRDNEELVYNALNQLKAYSDTKLLCDSNNTSEIPLDKEIARFENNVLSQLISLEKADKSKIKFSYDPLGRIIAQEYMKSTTRYLYIGNQEVGSLAENGAIKTLKIPGMVANSLTEPSIAFELNHVVYAPIHDVTGNVIGLIDPNSRQIIERYEYTAFGKESIYNAHGELEEFSTIKNPWRFAEKRKDEDSGLILFGFRFYNPTVGRWASEDPIGFIDGPNLYAYLHNNPLSYKDQFGLTTEDISHNKFFSYFYGEVENHCFCEKHRTCKRGGDVRSHFPKISYELYFEKFHQDHRNEHIFIENCYQNSTRYDLSYKGLCDPPNNLRIGFINGIWNDFKNAQQNALYISRLSDGYNIHGVYNATHGLSADLKECLLGLTYVATEPVRQLHAMWNSFFDIPEGDKNFLMICHSQGAIHVRNALLDYPKELRDRIIVISIAPGAYIYQETCAQVANYRAYAHRDFIPRLDHAGSERSKNNTFDLESDPKSPFFDHGLMNPTYEKVLRQRIQKYIQTAGRTL